MPTMYESFIQELYMKRRLNYQNPMEDKEVRNDKQDKKICPTLIENIYNQIHRNKLI